MSTDKHFPNGFLSWIETFFEITSAIAVERAHDMGPWSDRIKRVNEMQGTGGFYELAEELTDKFEQLHEGEAWEELDFFETVENFIEEEFKDLQVMSSDEDGNYIEEPETKYENHYQCYRCSYAWTDVWTAMCDDDCPECGARHVSPHDSVEL